MDRFHDARQSSFGLRWRHDSSFYRLHHPFDGLSTPRWKAFTVRQKRANTLSTIHGPRWRRLLRFDGPPHALDQALDVSKNTQHAR